MAEKEFEGDDPMEFVAMRFPAPPGVDMDAAMARCFIEEYAMLGMPRNRILAMFRSPSFAGAHAVFAARGEAFIAELVEQVFGPARPTEAA